MAKEAFLINPPKRGKVSKAKRMRHRPMLYGPPGGPWKRSRFSKSKRKKVRIINPYLMSVGANPPKRRRRKSYRKRSSSRRRRGYSRNPAGGALTFRGFQKNLPYMLTGGISAIATTMAPGIVNNFLPNAPYMAVKLGSQIGTAVGGAFAIDMLIPRKGHGMVWMIVSGATIAADLIREYVLPQIGLSDYEVGAYELEDRYNENGNNGENMDNNNYDENGIDAFPDAFSDELDAFPDTGNNTYL